MNREVKLTKTAKTQLSNLLEFLEMSWSKKVKFEFIDKFDKRVAKVRINPNLFPRSFIKEGLHKCVVTKQTTFYYIHDEKSVTILTIFDTRQKPINLSEQIRDET